MSESDHENGHQGKQGPNHNPSQSRIRRFKLEDGREGFSASLGNGLTKLLFDNGDMAIVMDGPQRNERRPADTGKNSQTSREPSFPLVAISDIPSIIEQLSLGQGDPRYAVLMFLPMDSNDGGYVNLQYAVEDGVVGMEWVLIGDRNIMDRDGIAAFAESHGHPFTECEMNGVKYLRTVGQGLAELGMRMITGFYGFEPTTLVKLLAEGFDWPPHPTT